MHPARTRCNTGAATASKTQPVAMHWTQTKGAQMQLIEEVRANQALPAPAVARMIRATAGVSQERLARELGVHRMTVARWESGRRRPRGTVRAAYSALLSDLQRAVAS